MADEKRPGQIQTILFEHGEKIAVGVAGVLVVGYLLLHFTSSGPGPFVAAVREAAGRIENESRKDHPDRFSAPKRDSSSVVHNAVVTHWEAPKSGGDFGAGDWVASLLPLVETERIPIVAVPEKEIVLPALDWKDLTAGAKGVDLSWTVVAPKEDPHRVVVKIDRIAVERKNPDGTRVRLKELPGDATRYLDADVKRKTAYGYRLTPYTKDPKYRRKTGSDMGQRTAWRDITTIDIWKITFSQPNPDWEGAGPDGKPAKGRVYVAIEKEEPNGKVTITKFHVTGQRVGWWVERFKKIVKDEYGVEEVKEVEEFTSRHTTPKTGDTLIDFDTKLVILAIEKKGIGFKKKSCTETVRDPRTRKSTGQCKIVESEKPVFTIEVKQVRYRDAEGQERVWRDRDLSKVARPQPDYCEYHRERPPEK